MRCKLYFLPLFFASIVFPTKTNAQLFALLDLGGGVSHISNHINIKQGMDDTYYGINTENSFSINAGLNFKHRFKNGLNTGLGIGYSRITGLWDSRTYAYGVDVNYDPILLKIYNSSEIDLNYLMLPVHVGYEWKDIVFGTGFRYAFLVDASMETNGSTGYYDEFNFKTNETNYDQELDENAMLMKDHDYGVFFSLGYKIDPRVTVSLFYYRGLNNNFDSQKLNEQFGGNATSSNAEYQNHQILLSAEVSLLGNKDD